MRSNQNNSVSVCNRVTMPLTSPGVESAARAITKRKRRLDSSMAVLKLDSWAQLGEPGAGYSPRGVEAPGPPRCYLSRMPRDIDVVGVWHGTPYQVASVSSTANGVIVACGPAGKHTTYPKTGRRHTKDPSSSTGTWYERQVLADVTLAQPLQVIAFLGAKPPAWAKPHADRPSHDSFTFQALADGHVRLALVGVREADDAVIVVTKQAATAPRLFRRYAPNVLMWTV
jgi:hypothetical protein